VSMIFPNDSMTPEQRKRYRRARFLGGYWQQGYRDKLRAIASRRQDYAVAAARRALARTLAEAAPSGQLIELLDEYEAAKPATRRGAVPTARADLIERVVSVLAPWSSGGTHAERNLAEAEAALPVYEATLDAELAKPKDVRAAEARAAAGRQGPQALRDMFTLGGK
jgi:hypothetical protein